MSSPAPAYDRSRIHGALALWAVGAFTLALLNVVPRLPRPVIPIVIWTPVVAFFVARARSASMRAFVDALDLRWVVLFHVVRIYYGAMFLVEMSAGRMPELFARVAGPGDIVAGALAVPAAWLVRRPGSTARTLTLAWNAIALADILAVFVTAQFTVFVRRDPLFLEAIQRVPYSFLPVLVVPLVIATHGVVFLRLRRR